jgi:FAD/FMN-containing dehydrogenase
MANWEPLARILEGEVALPGSPEYEGAWPPFNARFRDLHPEAVVSGANPQDVAETIRFARRLGVDLVVRSGGHSFAGHSTCRGVVIDVSPMRSVSVSDGLATVGAGARLGEVYEALQEHGLAIPAGTCPTVGLAGLTLGGGLGILGRKHGVTSDRLVEAGVVLADGRMVTCDDRRDPDLFWALRGAGAGFGAVTSFVFQAVPAPETFANAHLVWRFARASNAIEAWQAWAPDAPDELAASLKVTATGEEEPSVDVYAAYLGDGPEAERLLTELVDRVGIDPIASSSQVLTFPETRRYWANLGGESTATDDDPVTEPVCLFSRSEFFRRSLPAEAIAALLETFVRQPVAGQSRELDFMPWGGMYNRVPSDATAFVHREERFQVKHAIVLDPEAGELEREAASRQVARSWGSVHRWGSGRVFQNFADPDLDQWSAAYHGTNLDRLLQVKNRYDPDDVFRSSSG